MRCVDWWWGCVVVETPSPGNLGGTAPTRVGVFKLHVSQVGTIKFRLLLLSPSNSVLEVRDDLHPIRQAI